MTEYEPGTLPYIVKKWEPLIKDLTGHPAEICAWIMEAEARYLRSDENREDIGASLKYTFPTIRRTVKALTTDGTVVHSEISAGVVREITTEALSAVFQDTRDLAAEDDRNALDQLHQAIVDDDFAEKLSGRIHAAIVTFPGV